MDHCESLYSLSLKPHFYEFGTHFPDEPKYVEARKGKQVELEKAQADLRQVITLHQEGTLVLMGILD